MKKKLTQIKKTVSDNRHNIIAVSVVSAFSGVVIYGAYKAEQADQRYIKEAREAGRTVIETPWGRVTY